MIEGLNYAAVASGFEEERKARAMRKEQKVSSERKANYDIKVSTIMHAKVAKEAAFLGAARTQAMKACKVIPSASAKLDPYERDVLAAEAALRRAEKSGDKARIIEAGVNMRAAVAARDNLSEVTSSVEATPSISLLSRIFTVVCRVLSFPFLLVYKALVATEDAMKQKVEKDIAAEDARLNPESKVLAASFDAFDSEYAVISRDISLDSQKQDPDKLKQIEEEYDRAVAQGIAEADAKVKAKTEEATADANRIVAELGMEF